MDRVERVLLVDDERRFVAALQRGLTAEGYEVVVAHDGITGQTLAEKDTPDLILLDIMMPGRSGYVVCRNLRAAGVTTPILMLTAKDGEYDEAEGLDMGADDYLTKPFHYVVLLARLRALIRRAMTPSVEASERVTVGDLELYPRQRRVMRGGEEIALTAKEFDLLAHLAGRAGAVVSKEELIDSLWDFAAPAGPNVVEVHVSSLRRKIDAPFPDKMLETVRGAGYRLSRMEP